MLDLVKIEFLKQRHQKLNLVVYAVVSLYLALICYYVDDARGLFDSFPFVYKFSLSYLNFLILPLYCVSYTIQVFGVEYRYRIMNNLKLASANLMKILKSTLCVSCYSPIFRFPYLHYYPAFLQQSVCLYY